MALLFDYEEVANGNTATLTTEGFQINKIIHASGSDPEAVLLDIFANHGAIHPLIGFSISIGSPHPSSLGSLGVVVTNLTASTLGGFRSAVVVTYQNTVTDVEESENGEIWEWNITSEQTHITSVERESLQTHFPPSEDIGVAIGVDGSDVHGTDVLRPASTLRVTKRITAGNVQSIKATAEDRIATVNSDAWNGYQIGEVLFQSFDLIKEKSNAGDPDIKNWRITYNFIIRRQRGSTDIDTTSGTVTIDPEAWDYVSFIEVETEADGKKRTLIKSVHIAKTQPRSQFGAFNLTDGENF